MSLRKAALFAAMMFGCRSESSTSAAPPASAGATFVRGETIIVEQTAAVFQETRVLEVQNRRLRVDFAEGADSVWIESADVYRVGQPKPVKSGGLAICRTAPRTWSACKVESVDAAAHKARDAEGRTFTLSAADVLAPRPVTELNLKRHFERAQARRSFMDAIVRAGSPRRADHWLPGPRARVLARRDGQWFSAQIHEFDEEIPRVSFALDGRITELPLTELAPEPPYDVKALRRGDFVLVRPSSKTQPWRAVEIRSLGDQELRVADVNGELSSVSLREVVPLTNPAKDVSADR